jgi:Copper amine oxidase N-terminal domain.
MMTQLPGRKYTYRRILILFCALLLLSTHIPHDASAQNTALEIKVLQEQAPYPMREILENINIIVSWNSAQNLIVFVLPTGEIIKHKPNSDICTRGGDFYQVEDASLTFEGITYVSVEFLQKVSVGIVDIS